MNFSGVRYVWSTHCEDAFNKLKESLTKAPTLAFADFSKPFQLYVDASGEALGVVLEQEIDGEKRVIAYAGRGLQPAELNYTITEKECLSVIFGIKSFEQYLYGREFTIYTDHSALTWLLNLKEPKGRLARWVLLLQEYNYNIKHKPGRQSGNADALFRGPYDSKVISSIHVHDKNSQDKIRSLQCGDSDLKFIIYFLKHYQVYTENRTRIFPGFLRCPACIEFGCGN
ncbi:MAG: ribonuclease H family protein [Bacteroidota bacterium]